MKHLRWTRLPVDSLRVPIVDDEATIRATLRICVEACRVFDPAQLDAVIAGLWQELPQRQRPEIFKDLPRADHARRRHRPAHPPHGSRRPSGGGNL